MITILINFIIHIGKTPPPNWNVIALFEIQMLLIMFVDSALMKNENVLKNEYNDAFTMQINE